MLVRQVVAALLLTTECRRSILRNQPRGGFVLPHPSLSRLISVVQLQASKKNVFRERGPLCRQGICRMCSQWYLQFQLLLDKRRNHRLPFLPKKSSALERRSFLRGLRGRIGS